jgi:septin family protein
MERLTLEDDNRVVALYQFINTIGHLSSKYDVMIDRAIDEIANILGLKPAADVMTELTKQYDSPAVRTDR